MFILFLLGSKLAYCSYFAEPNVTNGTIYLLSDGSMQYKANAIDESGLAYATFKDGLHVNGWGVLDIVSGYSSGQQKDSQTMFAAGFLEGALTYRCISTFVEFNTNCNYRFKSRLNC